MDSWRQRKEQILSIASDLQSSYSDEGQLDFYRLMSDKGITYISTPLVVGFKAFCPKFEEDGVVFGPPSHLFRAYRDFSLAHEIGHLVLEHGVPRKNMEREANLFASRFTNINQWMVTALYPLECAYQVGIRGPDVALIDMTGFNKVSLAKLALSQKNSQ